MTPAEVCWDAPSCWDTRSCETLLPSATLPLSRELQQAAGDGSVPFALSEHVLGSKKNLPDRSGKLGEAFHQHFTSSKEHFDVWRFYSWFYSLLAQQR